MPNPSGEEQNQTTSQSNQPEFKTDLNVTRSEISSHFSPSSTFRQADEAEQPSFASISKGEEHTSALIRLHPTQSDSHELERRSVWQSAGFFINHSFRDVKRRKCHFCLAFCSVFIVVLSTLLINTVIAKGPIIFLKLAETNQGEFDGIYTPRYHTMGNWNQFGDYNWFINYPRILELYNTDYNLAPRKQQCDTIISSDETSNLKLDPQDPDQLAAWRAGFNPDLGLPTRDQMKQITPTAESYKGCFMLMDTQREADISLGLTYPFEPQGVGECLVNENLAQALDVSKGGTIYLNTHFRSLFNTLIQEYNDYAKTQGLEEVHQVSYQDSFVDLPCKISNFTSGTYGKFPKVDVSTQIIMEYQPFVSLLVNYLPTAELQNSEGFKDYLLTQTDSLYKYADMLMMTLPSPRYIHYQDPNFDNIQKNVLEYSNEIVQKLGFYPIETQLALLGEMQTFSLAVLFIGLVFNIIIILFVIVSVLLIYSLLMITVETKTFEIGVMRLVGLSENGFVAMIGTQAVMFVLPSIVSSFLCMIPCFWLLYENLFTEELGFEPSYAPEGSAVVQALFLGLLIPAISSIVPIRQALSKELAASLNVQRSKASGVIISIMDSSKQNIVPYILFGVLSVTFGISIYILLPMAMLSENYSLILQIFFMILLGMILGLTLLAFNLQGLIQSFLTYTLLCWEKSSTRQMVTKNLLAHKQRNKLTAIIYALTLGCIIFLVCAANLQIQQINLLNDTAGADMIMTGNGEGQITPALIDPLLQQYASSIKDFAYISKDLKQKASEHGVFYYQKIADTSRLSESMISYVGVQPSEMLDKSLSIDYQDPTTSLGLTSQLYTARGSQGFGVQSEYTDELDADPSNPYSKVLFNRYYGTSQNTYYQMRPLMTFEREPSFGKTHHDMMMTSLPLWSFQADIDSIDNLWYDQVLVQLHDPSDTTPLKEMIKEIKSESTANISFTLKQDQLNQTAQVQSLLQIIFNVTIAITMFLCFFALTASMSANLYEQTKEIAVLRAMGVTKKTVKSIYFYEAFILVLASCILGVVIGCTVGYTMVLQQALIQNIPLAFMFPLTQFLIIFFLSIVCAFFSTYGPTTQLTRKHIASLFRSA